MAMIWLSVHLVGVAIAFLLMFIISRKEDTDYKSMLLMAIACCLVTLVTKCFYIMGGSLETMLVLGKIEYLGKCFANFFALLFILKWEKIKLPDWLINLLFLANLSFFILISTVGMHHLYYREYWLAPSDMNLSGHILSSTPAPLYYLYMITQIIEITGYMIVVGISFRQKQNSPNYLKYQLHASLLGVVLAPLILLTMWLLGVIKGDDPTPLGILLASVFMSLAVIIYGLFDPVRNAKDTIIQKLTECLIVADMERNFLYLNPAAETLTNHIYKKQGYYTDQSIYDFIKRDGEYFDWDGRHYRIHEQELKVNAIVQGYMLSVVDITEIMEQNQRMKELVEQAESANRAKSAFVSNISHEIRTPMNSIVGIAEILLRRQHDEQEEQYLQNIQDSGQALLAIINDVLDFSKMESGKMQLFEEPYDTLSLYYDMKVIFENRIGDRSIKLLYDLDQNLPCRLIGDAGRLRQIIVNLVGNAIKYTEEGHVKLTVRLQEREQADHAVQLYIAVEDTGVGIKEEDQQLLFDSFERVDVKKNREKEGTGLGLAISRDLVQRMGGDISLHSVYGEGSTFFFTIRQGVEDWAPIREAEPVREKRKKKENKEWMFEAPEAKVLLVDDNDMNLVVAKALLEPLKIQIETARNGAEALQMVKQKAYDLVLMDHMMPIMDGIEATKEIRKLPEEAYRTLPIIALTANAMIDARKEFEEAGMNGFVAKPIEFSAICRELYHFLPPELVHNVTEEDAQAEDKVEEMPDIPMLDLNEGVRHCGTQELLKKTMAVFYQTIDRKADLIEQYFLSGDIKAYTVEVHALKSSARLIGATELSALAKELEEWGHKKEIAPIKEKTGELLSLYRSYKELLRPYVGEKIEKNKELSQTEWAVYLTQIREHMEQFDLDFVDETMEELKQYMVPEKIAKEMELLYAYVADVAMEDVMQLCESMCGKLQVGIEGE